MATVFVLPGKISIEVSADQTVMAAAETAGYIWPTVCGGEGTCITCMVRIDSQADNAVPPDAWEVENLQNLPASVRDDTQRPARLACQMKITGDVHVHKVGVRPALAPVETAQG